MSRLIIGYGNTGKHIDALLRLFSIDADIYDIIKERIPAWREVKRGSYDVCHICVNDQYVLDACRDAIELYSPNLLIVHSTTQIGTLDKINYDVLHHPLFFREKKVFDDVNRPNRVLLSCNNWNNKHAKEWADLMMKYAQQTNALFRAYNDLKITEFIKVATNCIRAVIITLYNSLYDEAKTKGIEDNIIRGLVTDVLRVDNVVKWERENYPWGCDPLLLGKAFSGYCLPKDIEYLEAGIFKMAQMLNHKAGLRIC